jgi:hypothetical protein
MFSKQKTMSEKRTVTLDMRATAKERVETASLEKGVLNLSLGEELHILVNTPSQAQERHVIRRGNKGFIVESTERRAPNGEETKERIPSELVKKLEKGGVKISHTDQFSPPVAAKTFSENAICSWLKNTNAVPDKAYHGRNMRKIVPEISVPEQGSGDGDAMPEKPKDAPIGIKITVKPEVSEEDEELVLPDLNMDEGYLSADDETGITIIGGSEGSNDTLETEHAIEAETGESSDSVETPETSEAPELQEASAATGNSEEGATERNENEKKKLEDLGYDYPIDTDTLAELSVQVKAEQKARENDNEESQGEPLEHTQQSKEKASHLEEEAERQEYRDRLSKRWTKLLSMESDYKERLAEKKKESGGVLDFFQSFLHPETKQQMLEEIESLRREYDAQRLEELKAYRDACETIMHLERKQKLDWLTAHTEMDFDELDLKYYQVLDEITSIEGAQEMPEMSERLFSEKLERQEKRWTPKFDAFRERFGKYASIAVALVLSAALVVGTAPYLSGENSSPVLTGGVSSASTSEAPEVPEEIVPQEVSISKNVVQTSAASKEEQTRTLDLERGSENVVTLAIAPGTGQSIEGQLIDHLMSSGNSREDAGKLAHRMMLEFTAQQGMKVDDFEEILDGTVTLSPDGAHIDAIERTTLDGTKQTVKVTVAETQARGARQSTAERVYNYATNPETGAIYALPIMNPENLFYVQDARILTDTELRQRILGSIVYDVAGTPARWKEIAETVKGKTMQEVRETQPEIAARFLEAAQPYQAFLGENKRTVLTLEDQETPIRLLNQITLASIQALRDREKETETKKA